MKKINTQTQQGNSATQGVARGGGGGRGAKKRPNNQQQQSNPNTQGAGQGANRGRGAGGRGANKGRGAGGRGANKGRGAGGLGAARGAGRGSVGNYGAARGFGGNRGAARGLVRNMGGGHVASGGPNAWDFMPPKNYSPGYGNNTRSYPDQIDDRVQYREPAPYEQSARFDEQSARQSARFDEQSARQSARFDGQSARFDEQSARYDERPRYNEQSYQYSSQEPDVKLNSAMETLSKLSRSAIVEIILWFCAMLYKSRNLEVIFITMIFISHIILFISSTPRNLLTHTKWAIVSLLYSSHNHCILYECSTWGRPGTEILVLEAFHGSIVLSVWQ